MVMGAAAAAWSAIRARSQPRHAHTSVPRPLQNGSPGRWSSAALDTSYPSCTYDVLLKWTSELTPGVRGYDTIQLTTTPRSPLLLYGDGLHQRRTHRPPSRHGLVLSCSCPCPYVLKKWHVFLRGGAREDAVRGRPHARTDSRSGRCTRTMRADGEPQRNGIAGCSVNSQWRMAMPHLSPRGPVPCCGQTIFWLDGGPPSLHRGPLFMMFVGVNFLSSAVQPNCAGLGCKIQTVAGRDHA